MEIYAPFSKKRMASLIGNDENIMESFFAEISAKRLFLPGISRAMKFLAYF